MVFHVLPVQTVKNGMDLVVNVLQILIGTNIVALVALRVRFGQLL